MRGQSAIVNSVIDTPWSTEHKATELVSAGVACVIRYYNHRNSSRLPEKRLRRAEADALAGAGLTLAVVFQQRQNQIGDFDRAKGRRAGRRAGSYARARIAQPSGSGIYFSVDFDAQRASELERVRQFFSGVHEGVYEASGDGIEYRIGAYGSGTVLQTLMDDHLAALFWLAMSRGWSGTRSFYDSGRWHLNQLRESSVAGLDVDLNETNPSLPDFGAFDPAAGVSVGNAQAAVSEPFATGERYEVIARRGLRLRAGPGTDFDVLAVMPFGTTVYVLRPEGAWALVDLLGDGRADGHAHLSYLQLSG